MRTVRHRRKFEHGQENTLTTTTLCLKDVFSRKTPTIDADNGQKRNIENVLEALRVLVAEKEEISRQRIDDLERNSKGVKALKAKKKKVLKREEHQKVLECPQREKQPPAKLRDHAGEVKDRETFAVGQMLEVLWNEKDLQDTNWKPGWYRGEVQRFDEENNVVCIWYYEDRVVYGLDATGALVDGVIRPV